MKTFVKICGLRTIADMRAAGQAGADAVGLIFAASPRRIDVDEARDLRAAMPDGLLAVGVFRDEALERVNETAERVGLDLVQLHGDESPDYCAGCVRPVIRRHDIPDAGSAVLRRQLADYAGVAWHLLDPGAGSGRTFDWRIARDLPGRVMVSGGLTVHNVHLAIQAARPQGVDVASGVERAPGSKDHALVRSFIERVRAADADADRH